MMYLPTLSQTLLTLPRAIRQGMFTSPSVSIPMSAAGKFLVLVSDMDEPTAVDPNTIVRAWFEVFNVASQQWLYGGGSDPNVPGSGYNGGVHLNKAGQQTQVFIGTGLDHLIGTDGRFVFDIPNAINTGGLLGFL